MNSKFRLWDAANVDVPAYLTLIQKGFKVRQQILQEPDDELWFAVDDTGEFVAKSPVELLGLISIYEICGESWQASDEEIDDFVKHFD